VWGAAERQANPQAYRDMSEVLPPGSEWTVGVFTEPPGVGRPTAQSWGSVPASKQTSIFICPINKQRHIISMNNVQGQAARKAHKAQHCWPPCKKILN